MLQAFIDDSEQHEGDQTYILAAYIHRAPQWAAFSDDWMNVLRQSPPMDGFHMAEATLEQRAQKLMPLAEVVARYKPWSFAVYVSRRDFNLAFKGVAPYAIRHPFFPCFVGIILQIAQWLAKESIALPVDFIFDEQGLIGAEAVMWYDYIKSQQPPEVRALMGSTPIFQSDKEVVPLQAADVLAWHLRRATESRFALEERPALEMLRGVKHAEVKIDRDALARMAKAFSSLPGVELTRTRRSWNAMKPELATRLAHGLGPPLRGDDLIERPRKRAPRWVRLRGFCSLKKLRRLLRIVGRFLFRR